MFHWCQSSLDLTTSPQVVLVVNVASKCGYTDSNYNQLVGLQRDYQDRGFTVLAFPSNQFGAQEPGTNQQILSFASDYDANFPIFSKVEVVGESACEVYRYLGEALGSVPTWNFCKYLVDSGGEVVQYFSVKDTFESIRNSVEYLLSRKPTDEL